MTPAPPPASYTSPPVTIILTIILLIFFFVGFFSLYFCRCFMETFLHNWYIRHNPTGAPVGPASSSSGLDPSIIKTFPTFAYSCVKDLRKEKYGLECAICISEFEDESVIRLLTTCCHVFHQECIDLWLELHKTCPVCRRGLDGLENSPEKSPAARANINAMQGIREDEALEEDTFTITISEDNEEERRELRERESGEEREMDIAIAKQKEGKFSRSHSTGHSIVRSTRGDEDKYTLRLPEHVKAKIIRGHNWTKSCTTFGEYKSKISTGNGGFAEVAPSEKDVNKV